jgi:hypothetical protein
MRISNGLARNAMDETNTAVLALNWEVLAYP